MCSSFPGLLIGRIAVHSGKDSAFVAYDQFLSTGILQPLSGGEVRCESNPVFAVMSAARPLFTKNRLSSAHIARPFRAPTVATATSLEPGPSECSLSRDRRGNGCLVRARYGLHISVELAHRERRCLAGLRVPSRDGNRYDAVNSSSDQFPVCIVINQPVDERNQEVRVFGGA